MTCDGIGRIVLFMKTTRIAPGCYTTTANGVTYRIVNLAGDTRGVTGWQWKVDGERAADTYPTMRAAVEALSEWIASTTPAAPALSLMERMARATEATRPAGCKTLALG